MFWDPQKCLKCLNFPPPSCEEQLKSRSWKKVCLLPVVPAGHEGTAAPPSQGKYLHFRKRNFKTLVFSEFHPISPAFPAQGGWLPPLWGSPWSRDGTGVPWQLLSPAAHSDPGKPLQAPVLSSSAAQGCGLAQTEFLHPVALFLRINNNSCSATTNNPTTTNPGPLQTPLQCKTSGAVK